ncbi:Histone deacetylase 3 [Armadillidium vulgare]|nr:Histone deacetylase 3 [Armadillidium vulgare]
MTKFHSEDYIRLLNMRVISTEGSKIYTKKSRGSLIWLMIVQYLNVYDFRSMYTGSSLEGAVKLNHDCSDIAINWSGGLHHAKKFEAGGILRPPKSCTGKRILFYRALTRNSDVSIPVASYISENHTTYEIEKFFREYKNNASKFSTKKISTSNYSSR